VQIAHSCGESEGSDESKGSQSQEGVKEPSTHNHHKVKNEPTVGKKGGTFVSELQKDFDGENDEKEGIEAAKDYPHVFVIPREIKGRKSSRDTVEHNEKDNCSLK
jgi:hypothetical protein